MYTVEGGNARSLSRLFDYAFTDKGKGRRQGIGRATGGSGSSRNGGANLEGRHLDGRQLDGRAGGGRPRATLPAEMEDAVRAGQDARSPQSSSSPPPQSRDALCAGNEKKTLVGVTVRRPQSPQFGFMGESEQSSGFMSKSDQSNGCMAENDQSDARQRCPSWQQGSPNTRLNDAEESQCVTVGDSKVGDAGQEVVRSTDHADTTGGYNEGPATPDTRMAVAGTAPSRSVEHSPLAGWAGEMPSPEAGAGETASACNHPRASKRRRPESWETTIAALAGTPPPFPLASAHPTKVGRSDPEETSQSQSRPIDHTLSPEAENGFGLEGSGGSYAGDDTVGAPKITRTEDAAWVQERGRLCDTNEENCVTEHAGGAGETMTSPPRDERSTVDGRAIAQPLEAGKFDDTLRLDGGRKGDANGWVEEGSQRVAGLQPEAGLLARTPRVDSAREEEANGWLEEGSQQEVGPQPEAEMFAEMPRLDSVREREATGWVAEDSQQAAGFQLEAEMFAGTPRLGSAPEGEASGWIGEDSHGVAGLQLEAGMFAGTPRLDNVREGEANGRVEQDSQRAIGLPLDAGMLAETPPLDSGREGDGNGDVNGRVEEDSQRVPGNQLEAGMFAETPRLGSAHEGDASGWVDEDSQRLAGPGRLDHQHERFMGGDETTPDVGATPGTPSPRPEAESGNNRNGPRDRSADDASNVKELRGAASSARAVDAVLAYDRDVLGGDGLVNTGYVGRVGWFQQELDTGLLWKRLGCRFARQMRQRFFLCWFRGDVFWFTLKTLHLALLILSAHG